MAWGVRDAVIRKHGSLDHSTTENHLNIGMSHLNTVSFEFFYIIIIICTCRSITRSYYRNSVGVLIVFDITKRKSYENVCGWLTESKQHIEPHNAVYVIVGQKSDLDEERQVTSREGRLFAETNGLRYFETSAKTGVNIEEAFLSLAKDIYKLLEDGKITVEEGWDGVKNGFARPKEPFHLVEGEAESGGCC